MNKQLDKKNNSSELTQTGVVDRRIRKTIDAIYTAASQLFKRKKFRDITMKELAKAADISRATLYNHYASKSQIYFEMGYERFKTINSNMQQLKNHPSSGFEIVIKLCSDIFHTIRREPMYNKLIYLFMSHKNFKLVNQIVDNKISNSKSQELLKDSEIKIMVEFLKELRKYEELWAYLIQKGKQDNSISSELEPIQLAHYLFLIINGTADQMELKKYVLEKFELSNQVIIDKTITLIKKVLKDA